MAKFRKKPVVVEAEIFQPGMEDGTIAYRDLPGETCPSELFCYAEEGMVTGDTEFPYIATLEGPHFIRPGDWIITGIQNERYPCKPDIFEATYEPVDE